MQLLSTPTSTACGCVGSAGEGRQGLQSRIQRRPSRGLRRGGWHRSRRQKAANIGLCRVWVKHVALSCLRPRADYYSSPEISAGPAGALAPTSGALAFCTLCCVFQDVLRWPLIVFVFCEGVLCPAAYAQNFVHVMKYVRRQGRARGAVRRTSNLA